MLICDPIVCSVEAFSSLVTVKYSLQYYQCSAENSISNNGFQFVCVRVVSRIENRKKLLFDNVLALQLCNMCSLFCWVLIFAQCLLFQKRPEGAHLLQLTGRKLDITYAEQKPTSSPPYLSESDNRSRLMLLIFPCHAECPEETF